MGGGFDDDEVGLMGALDSLEVSEWTVIPSEALHLRVVRLSGSVNRAHRSLCRHRFGNQLLQARQRVVLNGLKGVVFVFAIVVSAGCLLPCAKEAVCARLTISRARLRAIASLRSMTLQAPRTDELREHLAIGDLCLEWLNFERGNCVFHTAAKIVSASIDW